MDTKDAPVLFPSRREMDLRTEKKTAAPKNTKKKRNPKKRRRRKTPPPSLAGIANLAPLDKRIESRMSSSSKRQSSKRQRGGDGFESTSDSLALIAQFHTLNKRLEQNKRNATISKDERKRIAATIQQEKAALGGIERYQEASMFGAKSGGFVCANWVEPILRAHFVSSACSSSINRVPMEPVLSTSRRSYDSNDSTGTNDKTHAARDRRVRILDVGAIDNQYLDYTWFDAVPIDLNAQHPSVRAIDFFDFAQEHVLQQPPQPFDAIVQSLVLNFQGDPRRRGDMLALAADPRMLATNGLLFVALPSASLENSRYCTIDHFVSTVCTLGLRALEVKKSAKLILLVFKAERHDCLHDSVAPRLVYNPVTQSFDYPTEIGRKELHPGKTRNNFAVMLKNTSSCTT